MRLILSLHRINVPSSFIAPIIADLDGVCSELKRGANIEHRNESGETPLIRAAVGEDPEILKLLIGRSAEVNSRDNHGRTPLMSAARYCTFDFECLKVLLQAGANANATDDEGETALDHVCPVHGTATMKRLLNRHMKTQK